MKNKELTLRIKALLVDIDPAIRIRIEEGTVFIDSKINGRNKQKKHDEIYHRLNALTEINHIEISMDEDFFDRLTGMMR